MGYPSVGRKSVSYPSELKLLSGNSFSHSIHDTS